MNLADSHKRVNSLIDDIANLALEVVDDEAIEILQNRLEQGKRADGNSFDEYKPLTLEIKRATGGFISPSGNKAWKDRGDFYDSMKLRKANGFMEIDSDDEKAAKIFERAPDVLDISIDENNEIFENKRDEMINNFEKYLFG